MRFIKFVILLLSAYVVGCTTSPETLALIEQSERVVVDYPDSALLLIRSVDPDRVYGRRDKAHYRLAYSEALYHNQIDSDCDSLTRPLFEYYYDSDLHAERARAMCQHALVMQNAQSNSEAIHTFLEAEKSLRECDNPRLLGLVYRSLGDIYYFESLFGEAISSFVKAKECFDRADLPYYSLYTSYQLGRVYSDVRQFDNAIDTFVEAESIALQGDTMY